MSAESRFFANPLRDPRARFPAPRQRAREVHARLPGYAPTPLGELPALAAQLGVGKVFLKDESARFGLPAFKVLGASFAIICEIEDRCAARGLDARWSTLEDLAALARQTGLARLVTATDGNHGRGVARVARWLGLDACVFMPGSTVPARSEAIESEGATVQVIGGAYEEAVRLAAAAADEPGSLLAQDTAWSGYERIPSRIVAGYETMLEEIDEQLGEDRELLDLVILPVGVGSLADAMVRHFRSETRQRVPRLVSVEPSSAACLLASLQAGRSTSVSRRSHTMMAGLDCGTLSSISWPVLRAGVDMAICLDDSFPAAAMRALAREGLVSGESGAAGLAALLALSKERDREAFGMTRDARVLLLSTEGATDPENYERVLGC